MFLMESEFQTGMRVIEELSRGKKNPQIQLCQLSSQYIKHLWMLMRGSPKPPDFSLSVPSHTQTANRYFTTNVQFEMEQKEGLLVLRVINNNNKKRAE